MAKVYSIPVTASASTVTLDNIDPHFNQLFVAAKYFSDATGDTEVTPTAGTIAVEGRPNGAGGYSSLSMSPLDCTDTGDYASTSVPLDSIRFTPTGITGAAYYQITVTAKAE